VLAPANVGLKRCSQLHCNKIAKQHSFTAGLRKPQSQVLYDTTVGTRSYQSTATFCCSQWRTLGNLSCIAQQQQQ